MKEDTTQTKILISIINQKISDIVEKLRINKYSKDEEDIIFNLINKILLNERTKIGKKNLLNVIEKVSCYKDADINEYINAVIEQIINSYSQRKYIVCKGDIGSSNHSIVSNLIKNGYIEKERVIKYSKKNIEYKEMEENNIILIVDDYIGSGKSIIDILKAIELKYKDQNIKIISYIWQEKAMKKIDEYIKETVKNNKYEIYYEDSIIENTYLEKFDNDSKLLNYIKCTCNTCLNKDYKFGYKNTGAMLTINGLSPNNNISMLWRYDLGDDKTWIPPFCRDINVITLQKKKDRIIKGTYIDLQSYYKDFIYKDSFSFEEFKMMLLLFNSYYINIKQITNLLGLDTENDTKEIIEKFMRYGIIRYEVDNILEFIDNDVIKQFKKINQQLSRYSLKDFKKECTNNF